LGYSYVKGMEPPSFLGVRLYLQYKHTDDDDVVTVLCPVCQGELKIPLMWLQQGVSFACVMCGCEFHPKPQQSPHNPPQLPPLAR